MKEKLSLQLIGAILVTSLASQFGVRLMDSFLNSDTTHAQITTTIETEIKSLDTKHVTDITAVNNRVGVLETDVASVKSTVTGQSKQLDRIEGILTRMYNKP